MSTSGNTNFPPEIIEAILRLLPAKSLGRFKSVSKTWNSLISSPQFIKTHLHHTKKLLLGSGTSLYSIDLNQILQRLARDNIPVTGKEISFGSPPINWVEILGSCNGLVLANDENDAIYLVNPTTQNLFKVPIPPFALPNYNIDEMFCLVKNYFVRYGFGYDSVNDDYKVVSVSFWNPESGRDPECTDTFVSVYSLRDNLWRKLPNSPYDHTTCYAISGALVNESYHWLVSRSTIVAFSLAEERFNEIRLPGPVEKSGICNVVDIGGKLGVSIGLELWVMEEYGVFESWTCRVCGYGSSFTVRPVCLVEGSDRDIVFEDLGWVFVYNIDQRRRRNVRMVGGPRRFPVGLGGTYYVESLESPKPPHALSSSRGIVESSSKNKLKCILTPPQIYLVSALSCIIYYIMLTTT